MYATHTLPKTWGYDAQGNMRELGQPKSRMAMRFDANGTVAGWEIAPVLDSEEQPTSLTSEELRAWI